MIILIHCDTADYDANSDVNFVNDTDKYATYALYMGVLEALSLISFLCDTNNSLS